MDILLASSVALTLAQGRAVAQAFSRWLPTAAVCVRAQVKSCGSCGGQNDTGADFLFGFPCQFHRLLHTHHSGLVQQAS
jgi:hypothetical protein